MFELVAQKGPDFFSWVPAGDTSSSKTKQGKTKFYELLGGSNKNNNTFSISSSQFISNTSPQQLPFCITSIEFTQLCGTHSEYEADGLRYLFI
jgi:hypothetical protein